MTWIIYFVGYYFYLKIMFKRIILLDEYYTKNKPDAGVLLIVMLVTLVWPAILLYDIYRLIVDGLTKLLSTGVEKLSKKYDRDFKIKTEEIANKIMEHLNK